MAAETPLAFQGRLALKIGNLARERARKALKRMATDSRQARAIRESMEVKLLVQGSGQQARVSASVTVPFYWAVYYHDGRGPVVGSRRSLVFFKQIEDDPRVAGGRRYPVRSSDIRRLTRSEFLRARARGQLIVTSQVGPAPAHPFFTVAMDGFSSEVGPVVRREFGNFVLACLKKEDLLRVRSTVKVRL